MAVPTALPIELSSVCLEIYGSTSTLGKTLNTCFSVANGTFDPTYVGVKDRLTNFRGYVHGGAQVFTLWIGLQKLSDTSYNFAVVNNNATSTNITIRYTLVSISSGSGYVTIDGTNLTTASQTKEVSDTNLGSLQEPITFNNTEFGDTASVKCEVISSTLSGTIPTTPTFMTANMEEISCTRPTGLTSDTAQSAATINSTPYTFYNVSLSEAKSVWDILIAGTLNSISGSTCEYASLSVSETVYLYQSPITNCTTLDDGWYWFNENPPSNTVDIVTISGGVITAIEAYSAP